MHGQNHIKFGYKLSSLCIDYIYWAPK